MKVFLVGGFLRDEFLGVPSKDVDFAVEGESFDSMVENLTNEGFNIWQERPQYFTVRAGIPDGHPLRSVAKDADFVLCRKDGESSDNRRPDWVDHGTIFDDLARRDFTVNAMARNMETGELLDPQGGRWDLRCRILRCVGDPMERFKEDGLRILRAIRFTITKDLTPSVSLLNLLQYNTELPELVSGIAIERVREEIGKIFQYDTANGLQTFMRFTSPELREAIFRDGLWLRPTLRGNK